MHLSKRSVVAPAARCAGTAGALSRLRGSGTLDLEQVVFGQQLVEPGLIDAAYHRAGPARCPT
jgi:hypothetical protein